MRDAPLESLRATTAVHFLGNARATASKDLTAGRLPTTIATDGSTANERLA
jgi:hypothetical protein